MILRELIDQVKIENIAGSQINPATEDTLGLIKTVLDAIDTNTDTLETKTQSIRDQLDVLLSTRVSEATGQSLLDAIGEISGSNLIIELQNIVTSLGSGDLATESTLVEVRDYLNTVETKLQTIIDSLDVNLSTRASEVTLSEVRDTIGQESGKTVLSELDGLNNKDFSTETTLSSVLSQLDITLSALRDAIKGTNNKDFSTLQTEIEAILVQLDVDLSTRASDNNLQSLLNATGEASGTSILNELQSILSQLDVALSTRASESSLVNVKTNLDDIKGKLDTLNNTDFSTESTLASVLNALGESSGVTLLSVLESINSKDFATQTTLALIKTAIDTINSNINVTLSSRATEATLASIKTAIDAINSDIDVTLSTRASEATLSLVKINLDDVKTKLDTLIAKDFATETTSSAILNTVGEESGSTVLSKLQNIWDKLTSLFTDGLAKIKIWDGVNTALVSSNGELESRIIQNNKVSLYNNYTDNIASGASFTGTGESTLGVRGIQINFKATQNFTLEIQQSMDNVNWDISDIFQISANVGDARTFQATANYFRIIISNTGASTTTSLRLQTILSPIVEVLPRALSYDGRLKVESTSAISPLSLPIQIRYDKTFSAVNANEWQEIGHYLVPIGYSFTANSLRCYSATAGEKARLYIETVGGTFNCATNTFIDASALVAPQFNSGIYALVTTQIGSAVNDIFTITYTNEKGDTGRTCTIEITKSSVVGTAIEGVLQGNDLGIRDITNITHSATGQAGAVKFDMYYSLFNLLMSSSSTMYQAQSISGNPIVLLPNTEIVLAVLAGTKTPYNRFLSITGTLDPV